MQKASHNRFLGRHRELAQCSFTIFALFVPTSSFMRRQNHVDTIGMSALLRFGNFLQVRRASLRLRELYQVFVSRNHISLDKFNSAMQTLKEHGCADFESQQGLEARVAFLSKLKNRIIDA